MYMQELKQHLRLSTFFILIQAGFAGFISGELWHLGNAVSIPINSYIANNDLECTTLVICGVYLVMLLAYAYGRDSFKRLNVVVRSGRLDLLMMIVLGILVSVSCNGLGADQYKFIAAKIKPLTLILLIGMPLVVSTLLLVRVAIISLPRRGKSDAPFFLGDEEKKTPEEDLLGFRETAAGFAERVLNGNSPKSLVFGIDAPWGTGKSSFVNFCSEYWSRECKDKVIVYRFEPLRFAAKTDLLQRFVDDLVVTIQRSEFIPELRTIVSRYRRLISGNSKISLMGGVIDLRPGSWTVEDSMAELESALSRIKKKIVVVVDDLDRLEYSKIIEILFAIQKGFKFPNISYVLCYDIDNIVSLKSNNQDAEKVREFLEKFVNVKIGLFLDSSILEKFVSENFKQAAHNNLNIDNRTIGDISRAMSVLGKIYRSTNYHQYQEILGDVRKLKRLINTLLLFEIQKTDFANSDFDEEDLVHLLLIYISYPNIFRKIYCAEADGKTGFFSLTIDPGASSSPTQFVNSDEYIKYANKQNLTPQFLLNRIFATDIKLKNNSPGKTDEIALQTFACFNGGPYAGRRNLERYLNLIVKLSKPAKLDSYKFYLNKLDEIKKGIPIEQIFDLPDFNPAGGETSRNQLWRIVVNASDDLDAETGRALLQHILTHVPKYSQLLIQKLELGARDEMGYRLLKLVNQFGRGDLTEPYLPKTPENFCEIAEWIFGEGRHVGEGIIDTLGNAVRGPLGWYDLLIFRLYCGADRGGLFFNIVAALSERADKDVESTGVLTEIAVVEMREISQRIFSLFEVQYILPNRNIFDAIDDLTAQQLSGLYLPFVLRMVAEKVITQAELDDAISVSRAQLKGFIVYQLANAKVSSGVGCGFYDEKDSLNNSGIAKRMNDYLFLQCFASSPETTNFECFLDFMLSNFARTFNAAEHGGPVFRPHMDEYKKVLLETHLAVYWAKNKDQIRALQYHQKDKTVLTANYAATYKEDLSTVFSMLDEMLGGVEE